MTEAKRRGRPRTQETKDRDEAIIALLKSEGPLPRRKISEQLGINWSQTYLALERLKNNGRVKTCGGSSRAMVWTVATQERCP